jgi:hypothetical protein
MFHSTPYRLFCAALLCACGLVFSATPALAQAQASTGQISGVVRDAQGSAVPNVTVRAVNTQTGLEQTATSSEDGLFRFVLLPPGTYNLSAEASGFNKTELKGVVVNVGKVVDAPITLGVGSVQETVTVTAEVVQTTVSQPDAVINETQINNLPINGRRFQDFVTLTPTAQIDPQRGQISLSGQRGINSNINIDGVDYNQPFFGGIRGGERSNNAFTIPQESIKEFQVVAAGYSAEFGRSTGGVVTAVTKSGTNSLRGSAFYLIRHRELSRTNDYYDALAANLRREVIAAPTQQQFGGSIGGPIKQDKAFYFGSYEQQRFRNPRQVFFDNIATFTPTPATQPAFDFYKALQVPFEQTNDAKAGLVRFDYNFSEAHRFNIRYSQSNNNAFNANATGNALFPTTVSALSNNGTEKDRTYTVVGQLTDFFASNLVNELRAQYTREVRPRLANAQAPTIENFIGRTGTVSFLPTTQFDWRVQVFNNLSWILGNHSVKFGAEVNHTFADQTFAFNQFGRFNIAGTNVTTLLDILSYTPTVTGGTLNRFDNTAVTYLRQIGNGRLDLTVNEFALFAQDSWRVRPNFTLNYGLRWEGQFNPQPEASNTDLVNLVRNANFPTGYREDPTYIPDVADQFGPRLGFAWDPTKDGKTVIRGFAGIYYARTPMLLLAGPLNNFRNPPGDLSIQLPLSTASLPASSPLKSCNTVYCQLKLVGVDLNNGSLDNLQVVTIQQVQAIAGALGLGSFNPFTGAQPTAWADNYNNPKSYQWGGGIEREIARGISVGADYSQVNTIYLQRNRELNLPAPTVCANDPAQRPYYGVRTITGCPSQARPVPTLGSIQVRESSGRSVYQALTARVQLRRKRIQLGAFYTLSRNLSDDDNERDAGGIAYQDVRNLRAEFNYSRLDRRHQFVASPVVFLPYGFDVSSAIRLRSGRPIDASAGFDYNGDIGGPDRPYSAPGVPFKRNSFRMPALYDVDLRVQKGISFGEDRRLVFSAEFFNLLNLENLEFANAAGNYCTGSSTFNCGFGGPTNANFLRIKDANGNYIFNNLQGSAPFQVQFGARLQF